MNASIEAWVWRTPHLGEAIEALARAAGLSVRSAELPSPPANLVQPGGLALGRWIEGAASLLDIEAEPVESSYSDIERMLLGAGPAILRIFGGKEPRFVALLGSNGRHVTLVGPGHRVGHIGLEELRAALCEVIEAPLAVQIEPMLDYVGVSAKARPRARRALLRERLSSNQIRGCWVLRRAPGASLAQQAWHIGLGRRLRTLVFAHVAEYGIYLLAWWVVGRGALEGRVERGWLLAWAALLLSLVPFRNAAMMAGGRLAIEGGALLKQRLLAGALALAPDSIRAQGAGQLLGRVLESEAVESLGLGGGVSTFMACVDLLMASLVLGTAPQSAPLGWLLLGWLGLAGVLTWRYYRVRRAWTGTRFAMTNALVESIVGHRTRLAQEPQERWHEDEDRALDSYLKRSASLDRMHVLLTSLVPRGWLLVGTLALSPAFIAGTATAATFAVGIGGLLLAFRALRLLVSGLLDVVGASIAWQQVEQLIRSAAQAEPVKKAALPVQRAQRASSMLISAHRLVYRYPGRDHPVLAGCSLHIRLGDRILLEGRSGGGKTTLGAVLAGLRVPDQGVLLLEGLDRATLGMEGWRRHVAMAPQFHDNHVLSGSLAFNLLMGRRWPPRPGDLEEAEDVCRALDLGGLLDRMPAGLMQAVGETGWQLSHGEKSRLYVARTLLQGADLILLDESLAALDPQTMHKVLRCVIERAPTLLLIAHP